VNVHIEILKGHPIVRIRSFQQSLEYRKVRPRHQAPFGGISDAKQNSELRAADFRQVSHWCNCIDKVIRVQEPCIDAHRQINIQVRYWTRITPSHSLFAIDDNFRIRVECSSPPFEFIFGDSYCFADRAQRRRD